MSGRKFLSLLGVCLLVNYANTQGSLQVEFIKGSHLEDDTDSNIDVPSTSTKSAPIQPRFRLPRPVLPDHYDVKIDPIIDVGFEDTLGPQWDVPGEVKIHITCVESTSVITLHSKDVAIDDAETKVTAVTGNVNLAVTGCTFDDPNSFYIITLAAPLQVGQTYTIDLKFVSKISADLNGLYRSSYKDPLDGDRVVWLATTQMEALHARQLFPCFDEPALKATFSFTVGRHNKYNVLFNTEKITDPAPPPHPVDGWAYDQFERTAVMSSYLLALIVSEFTCVQATGNALVGKAVRTCAPKHYIDAEGGEYAAENADQLLAFFEEYFGQEYPLTKMDSAAVPDFYFGAMENWGLNIYRESALLYFDGISTEAERHTVSRILSHELAHQWFGNLVTCEFWTQIWLNEGFATYVAALGVVKTNPKYESWERFHNDAVQYSMLFDADTSYSHSVIIDEGIWDTKWAMDWFDRIAYEKGGSLILMMEGYLSEPVLKTGLRLYLDRMKFKAAVQDDLFLALNDAATAAPNKLPVGVTVKDIMDTWTLQPGLPLVRVSRAGANRIYISQERFVNNVRGISRDAKELGPNDLWYVPISIASQAAPSSDPAPELWIEKNVALKSWEIDTSKWIVLNAGATGYYRVLYDTALTALIRTELEADHEFINSVTRSQLLDDYFNSAWQGYVSIETAMSLTKYLAKEEKMVVWNTVFTNLRKAMNLFTSSADSAFRDFKEYLLPRIISALHATEGLESLPEEGMKRLRQLQFLDWACAMEHDDCINLAKGLYTTWSANLNVNPVPLDIQPVVYCAIVKHGDNPENDIDFIKLFYSDPDTTAKQKGLFLNAMGCATDISVILSILNDVSEGGFFPDNAARTTALQRLSMNVVGREQVVRWLRENYEAAKGRFTITSVVSTMATYVSTPAELETIVQFAADNELSSQLSSQIQTIQSNIRWMTQFSGGILSFIRSNS